MLVDWFFIDIKTILNTTVLTKLVCKAHCLDEEYQVEWWEELEDSPPSWILGEEEESAGEEDLMFL